MRRHPVTHYLSRLGALMAIAREELVEGGRCFLQTRLSYGSGAAVSMKLKPAKVLKVERAAAVIQTLADMRTMTVPFNQLAPDEQWLDERDRKEEQTRKRIEQERLAVESALGRQAPTLKHSLGDALKASGVVEPDDDLRDGVRLTPLDVAKLDAMRADAMAQLDALKRKAIEPVTLGGAQLATVHTLHPTSTTEPEPRAPQPVEPTPDPSEQPLKPIPQPQPEPEREAPTQPDQPLAPAAAGAAAPLDPTQMLLRKIQVEFEQLIAGEAELDEQARDAERQIAHLTSLLSVVTPKLAANRARQRVLSAQERQVLALAQAQASMPAPQPAPIPPVPTPQPAPEPDPTQPAQPDLPIPVPQRPLENGLRPGEVLRAHDTASGRKTSAERRARPGTQNALPTATGLAPAWLRRPWSEPRQPKSRPGSIAAGVSGQVQPRPIEARPIQPTATTRRVRGPARIDMSDPLERAIEEIAKAKTRG